MQQLTTTYNGLIPSNQESLAQQLLGILREAQEKSGIAEDDSRKFVEYPPDLQAQVMREMLGIASRRQNELKVSQAFIVAYISRNELYRVEGFRSLREFLRDTDLHKSALSVLANFGEIVVPYCDEHGIELHHVMAPDGWAKVRAVIAALKRAIKDDDPERVRKILGDVARAPGRDALRAKYQQRKHEQIGHGATYMLSNGQPVMIALLDDSDAAAQLVSLLDGRLAWDLLFVCTEEGLVFECPSQ